MKYNEKYHNLLSTINYSRNLINVPSSSKVFIFDSNSSFVRLKNLLITKCRNLNLKFPNLESTKKSQRINCSKKTLN